jgi:class 3 adenylate cyclase/tetratricopeptide (TPR) repeat protein
MRNLVPERIVVNLKNNKLRDEFDCFSMFVDISGFTSTTEALMKHGQEGAEVLSDILRYLFDTTVRSVYEHSGYVTKYAGDAFTAIFEVKGSERKTALNVLESALITNRFFKENKIFRSKFGDFEFGVKVGLGYGKTMCGIAGSGIEKSYFFSGSAVDLCAMAEHNAVKGDIWMSESVYKFISDVLIDPGTNNLYGLNFFKVTDVKPFSVKTVKYEAAEFDKELIYRLSGRAESEFPVGEFRDVISVFISFEGKVDLDGLMNRLYELKEIYGASHPVIDFGDKGGNILLFFGAPVSYENNSFRALSLINKLMELTGTNFRMRAGLAKGVVYCGFNGSDLRNEFTCLGNTVNQSARFMMKAEWGQILIDKQLASNENFVSEHLADLQYKGREGLIPTFILKSKAEVKDVFFKGSFVGREKEKEKFRKFLTPLHKGKNCGAIYVDGEAGIGKSRFTNQIRHETAKPGSVSWFYLSCDEIIREPYNPFKYFFQRYFEFSEEDIKKNTNSFDRKYGQIIISVKDQSVKKDLEKYRDYLAYFLSLQVNNPDVYAEEPDERQNSIIISLVNFFKAFSIGKGLVLEFDNAGLIDDDSVKLLTRLFPALKNKPLAVILNCRLKYNGEKYDFGLPGKKRIMLKNLTKPEFKALSADRLAVQAIPRETLTVLENKSRRNPLYLEQIVRYIQENSMLDNRNRIKDISGIPNGINDIIIARFDKLQSNLKEILKTASCIGNEINVDLISYFYRAKYSDLGKYLLELEDEDIFVLISEISYLFKFSLIRDAVYGIQLKKTVREIHELIGRALEELHSENLTGYYPVLAYHFENAENLDKAIEYHKKAGYRAKKDYHNSQALYHFDSTSKLMSSKLGIAEEGWTKLDPAVYKREISEYIEIGLERFHFYFSVKQEMEVCASIINCLSELSSNLNDDYFKGHVLCEKSLILANKGKYDESNKLLLEAVDILNGIRLPYKVSLSLLSVGKNFFMSGDFSKADEYYKLALDKSSELDDVFQRDKIKAKIYLNMGIAYDYSGNFDKALECYNIQMEISDRLNLKVEKSAAVGNMGVVYHLTGDLNKAREYYEQKLKLSEELGRRLELAQTLNNIGFLYKDLKNYQKALSYHRKSFSLSRELSDFATMAGASINMGHAYKLQKNYSRAESEFLKGIGISREYDLKYTLAEGLIELGEMLYSSGDKDTAYKYLKEGTDIASQTGFAEYIEKGKQLIGLFENK